MGPHWDTVIYTIGIIAPLIVGLVSASNLRAVSKLWIELLCSALILLAVCVYWKHKIPRHKDVVYSSLFYAVIAMAVFGGVQHRRIHADEVRKQIESKSNLFLRFVDKSTPSIVVRNDSPAIANDVVFALALWNVFRPDVAEPLQIPGEKVDWIGAHEISGPYGVLMPFEESGAITKGDKLLGAAAVRAPNCVNGGKSYFVAITLGEGGWYAELEGGQGAVRVPKNIKFLPEYFGEIENVPTERRMLIEDRE